MFKYLVLFIVLFAFVACQEDEPIEPAHEHLEASGMVLIKSGERFFKIFKGQIVSEQKALEVPLGGMTDHYSVKFLDDEGNEFDPPTDSDKSFGWEITDTSIVEIYRHNSTDWDFHLKGIKAGSTEIEFRSMHIDHLDFRTPKIPVVVKDMENTHGTAIGFRLIDEESGSILVQYDIDLGIIGSLNIKKGVISDHIEVVFFDSEGRTFTPEVPPHSLGVEIANKLLVGITGLSNDEPWAFKITGLDSGSTTLQITILHNGEPGIIFEGLIPIIVSE